MVRPLDNKVCLQCGERLPMTGRYCPHCGKEKSSRNPAWLGVVVTGGVILTIAAILWLANL